MKNKATLTFVLFFLMALCIPDRIFAQSYSISNYPGFYLISSPNEWTGDWTGDLNGEGLVSPKLDLSTANQPVFFCVEETDVNVSVSEDGNNYTLIYSGNKPTLIPNTTKYIKLNSKSSISYLGKLFCVAEYSSDLNKAKDDVTVNVDRGDTSIEGYIDYDVNYSNNTYGRAIEIYCNTENMLAPCMTFTSNSGTFTGGITFDFGYYPGAVIPNTYHVDVENCSMILIPRNTYRIYLKTEGTFTGSSFTENWMNRLQNPPIKINSLVDVNFDISNMVYFVRCDNNFPTNLMDFYDLDNDGVMEWKAAYGQKYSHWVYKFNSAFNNNQKIGESYGKWVNLNNDEWIDAYEYGNNNGYKKATLFFGDNTLLHQLNGAHEVPDGVEIQPIDYDNNGIQDFLLKDEPKGNIICRNATGEWMPGRVKIWTPKEYAGENISGPKNNLGTGIPGMEDMFVGSYTPPKATFDGYTLADLNGDGRTDFIDSENGCYYLNVGTDGLVEYSFGGQIMPRDLNGDGISDFLSFDADALKLYAYLTKEDGTSECVTLISDLYCNNKIWCYDFDKDGDVDVLIPFDYIVSSHKNGASYLVMMENKGDGTFKRHENYIDGETYFVGCLDIDADGCYEVIGRTFNNEKVYYGSYKVNKLSVTTTPEDLGRADLPFSIETTEVLADVNSSGRTYLMRRNFMAPLSDKVNEIPTAPTAPRYVYNTAEGTLKISWDAATDKESASLDLTYALRIGTEKEKGDILFANAQADGTRRNLQDGNNGYSRTRTLNVSSWPAGTYYISVQAIDPNRRGSKFSEYAIFEKKGAATDFIVSHKYYYAVGDTCTVSLHYPKQPGYTYVWNWGGGKLLGENADGISNYITFDEGGEKRISLQVFDGNGNIAGISERVLNVNKVNFTKCEDSEMKMAIDLDGDGYMERLKEYEYKFYEGDPDGNYTNLKYIYNTNLEKFMRNPVYILDKNRDGMPDIFSYSYGDYYTDGSYFLINEGDKQMTMSEAFDLTQTNNEASWLDIDNDGDLDQIHAEFRTILVNDGDYSSYTEIPLSDDLPIRFDMALDYDGDGLVDLIDFYRESNQTNIDVYINNGDYTFTLSKERYDSQTTPKTIADIDGDGKFDFVISHSGSSMGYSWSGDKYDIYWGAEELDSIPAPQGYSYNGLYCIYDVDNNGCLDIITAVQDSNGTYYVAVIYFYPGRNWKIETAGNRYDYYYIDLVYHLTNGDLMTGDYRVTRVNNEKPKAPTGLRATQNDKSVVLEWNHSKDKETPDKSMRYNISIKYKGKTGEGAYFYSPLNETKNGVYYPVSQDVSLYTNNNTIIPVRNLLVSNRFTIPIASIAPGEYEVQVQGIDRQEEPSDYSEIFILTVKESSLIDMPASGMVDDYITINILGNTNQTVSFGEGATIIDEDKTKGCYVVSYNTTGTKTVSVGSLDSQDIYISPRPEGAFVLPERIMKGSKVNVNAPNATMGDWSIQWGGNTYEINNDVCSSMEIVNDNQVQIHFKQHGNYTVVHKIYGNYYMANTISDHRVSSPTISIVNIDDVTGKHKINWNTATDDWMNVQSINVYKETSRRDVYALLANVPVEQGAYVDDASMPEVQTARYRLTYVTNYGESESSVAHQGIHLMINKGIGNTWNLMWSKYEGLDVSSYRILGGNSPDALQFITEVSGNLLSYSDLQTTEDMRCYAVEVIPATATRATGYSSRSNVVFTDDASVVNFAENIVIKTANGETTLTAEEDEMQLTAYIYPVSATYQRVNWIVVEGEEFATISANGLLKILGDGNVTVRAYALDGSDVYGEIKLDVTTSVENSDMPKSNIHLSSVIVSNELVIKGLPNNNDGALIYLFDSNGRIHSTAETTEQTVTLNCDMLSSGLYFVKIVLPDDSTTTVKFIKK